MPVLYELNQLLDERNRSLYAEVSGQLNVHLEPSDDDGWGSKIEDHDGFVYFQRSNYPISCFTHELLHLKFEFNGMALPSYKTDDPTFPISAIGFFHNQLVHHKIYPAFVGLGFKPQEFLNDDDTVGMIRVLQRDLKRLESLYKSSRKSLTGIPVAFPFFSINSPHDQSSEMRAFGKRLKEIADPETFANLEMILKDWKRSDNPNCSRPLAAIFKTTGYNRVGFSKSGTDYDMIYAADVRF